MKTFVACVTFGCLLASPVAAQTASYFYDALGRLTGVNESDSPSPATTAYEYDAAGNRKTVTVTSAAARSAARTAIAASRPSAGTPLARNNP